MTKKNRLYESMTRIQVGEHIVRVWRNQEYPRLGPDMEVFVLLSGMRNVAGDFAERLEALGNIEAYEIVDAEGNGVVVYPDWR